MKIDSLRFPDELYYDEHHQWANVNEDVVTVGLTDYAQSTAGDIVFVELPRQDIAVQRGQAFGSIESGKWVGRLYAPVSGAVVEVNEDLRTNPRALNREPYGLGWIARIKASDLSELEYLMRRDAARAFVAAEIERETVAEASGGDSSGES